MSSDQENSRNRSVTSGLLLSLVLFLAPSQPARAIDHYGYALVDPATGAITGYNTRGGTIELTRYDRAAGLSVVTFRRLADARFGGHVQVTAAGFNAGFVYCKIRSWESLGVDVRITVACYDMRTRRPTQESHKYSVLFLADHGAQDDDAAARRGAPIYLWTSSATNPITLPAQYAATVDRTYRTAVRRDAPGRYTVDLAATWASQGVILVTSYGPDNRYCQLESASDPRRAQVMCAGDTGYEDSQFTLLAVSRDLQDFPAARAMVSGWPGSVTAGSFLTNGGSVSAAGDWVSLTPDLPQAPRDQSAVFMTAISANAVVRCRPYSWEHSSRTGSEGQMRIQPQCFDASGERATSDFYMLVLGPPASTAIRAAPVTSPTPVATTLCGPPEGSPARDPSIERYFVPSSTYPSDANPGWHEDAMGLAHDNTSWYVTQYRRVWRIVTSRIDNARCDFDGVQCTTGASWPLPNAALAPMGDPAAFTFRFRTYLLVPIVLSGASGGSYVVVLDDRLDYITSFRLPDIAYITWVAVDGKGCVYTSQFGNTVAHEPEVRDLFRYVVDWNTIARRETVTPGRPERIRLSAGFHNVRGGEIAPSGLTLYLVAEGIHAIDLRSGLIIRSSTNGGSCFDFRFAPGEGERPAGLTIWDADFRDPRITGQLHVLVRDDDRPSGDEIRITHYTAGPSCR